MGLGDDAPRRNLEWLAMTSFDQQRARVPFTKADRCHNHNTVMFISLLTLRHGFYLLLLSFKSRMHQQHMDQRLGNILYSRLTMKINGWEEVRSYWEQPSLFAFSNSIVLLGKGATKKSSFQQQKQKICLAISPCSWFQLSIFLSTRPTCS